MERIELPVVTKVTIGTINTKENIISVNYKGSISYNCEVTGECCSRHQIPILDHEIQRIQSYGYEGFIEDLPPVKTPKGKTYWVKRIENKCIFLEENRCSIHQIKPFSCKLYPFSIRPTNKEDEFKIIIPQTNSCPQVKLTNNENSMNYQYLESILELLHAENNGY